MANNKVQLGDGTVLIDLTADTVTAATLSYGKTAHDKSGEVVTGTAQMLGFDSSGRIQLPETVIVPNTVQTIDTTTTHGFRGRTEIKHIIYEEGETALRSGGANTFNECTGLIDCVLPERFTDYQMPWFQKCTSLKSVNVPSSVTHMGDVFYNCTALETFTIPSAVTYLSGTFNGCKSLREVAMSKNITEISSLTFNGCSSLENINLPEGFTKIGASAFNGCASMTKIEFPSSLTSLGGGVCASCTGLKTLIYKSVPTCSYYANTSSNNPIYKCTALEDVQLPAGWTETLLLSNGTSNFTNVLTHDSMVAMIAALYDYSGGTAHTLTLGSTNLARLSDDEKAVAAAKNWTLA